MRLLIQRVLQASVTIEGTIHSQIGQGLLVFIAVHKNDTLEQAKWLAQKCVSLRIFEDEAKKMNLAIDQIEGEILIVSQFTLYGNCNEGKRPEFTESARGIEAKVLYAAFVDEVKKIYPKVETGVFAADMKISLINDGPITLIVEK